MPSQSLTGLANIGGDSYTRTVSTLLHVVSTLNAANATDVKLRTRIAPHQFYGGYLYVLREREENRRMASTQFTFKELCDIVAGSNHSPNFLLGSRTNKSAVKSTYSEFFSSILFYYLLSIPHV